MKNYLGIFNVRRTLLRILQRKMSKSQFAIKYYILKQNRLQLIIVSSSAVSGVSCGTEEQWFENVKWVRSQLRVDFFVKFNLIIRFNLSRNLLSLAGNYFLNFKHDKSHNFRKLFQNNCMLKHTINCPKTCN
jgi:hypothetical protein